MNVIDAKMNRGLLKGALLDNGELKSRPVDKRKPY